MTPKLALTVICCLCTWTTFAQTNYAIKGLVTDTTSKTKIDGATICVLNAKDSILQKFTYSNKGSFRINNLKPGKLLLLISYPDYADYTADFLLDATHPIKDFGDLNLILKSRLLNEVIIKAKVAAVKIKGDTTEFNAAAYATQKNAKVEDLLKQLPGMRINQSGVIIFQGETVDKVLVDGEEFFGDDPALVTKNIRADMVSKIQVYNQKSDQAKLTGMDDGVKVKTINVQLREDKRKGIFGKTEGEYGTDKYYLGQAMFNKFNPKEKFAAFVNVGNTGKTGLSGGDASKYGGGFGGSYDGVGIPLSRDGGIHYDGKWNKDKESINATYKLGALNIDGSGNTFTQNNLPGNFNTANQGRTFHNYSFHQALSTIFTARLDSTSDLSVRINADDGNSTSNNTSATTTLRGNGTLLNSSNIASTGSSDSKYLYAYSNYIKRLKKKGRSVSLFVSTSINSSTAKSYYKSGLNYYNNQGVLDSAQTIDQYKPNSYKGNSMMAGFSYTEPLSKSVSLSASYNLSQSISNSYKGSFNKSPTSNVYDVPDPAFSSDLKLVNTANTYSLNMGYFAGKIRFNLGTSVSNAGFKQTDKIADTLVSRHFINWLPTAYFSYQVKKGAAISLNYSGSTRQPSVYQLQPLRQNTDPLNITIGNPDLKPAFDNRVFLSYRLYEPTTDRGYNLYGTYTNSTNTIVNNRTTDSAGVNTYQWSNLKNRQPISWNVYAEVYGHIPKVGYLLSLQFTFNTSTAFNYVNKQLNKSRTTTYSPAIYISQNKVTYSLYFNIGPTYTVNTTSLQQLNNNSHGFFSNAGFYTKLPLNFFIGSDANYNYNARNRIFDHDFKRLLLKSFIGKSFLKDEGLKVSITGNDLLNQNTGYNRTGSADSYSEERNTTIRRYFMFSVTWDFSKFGKSLQKSGS